MSNQDNTITKQIADIGRKYKLDFIILHGSKVTGKTINPESDTDIAVYRKGGIDFKEELSLIGEFAHIYGDNVDVKTLHKKNSLFLYEAMRDSVLLYGNEDLYKEFFLTAYKKYHDSKDLFDNLIIMNQKNIDQLKSDYA